MGKLIDFGKSQNLRKGEMKMNVRLAKAILFLLVGEGQPVYKTKLNKLLFYAQFLYAQKKYGDLIEKKFIKDYYGPVIADIDHELSILQQYGLIDMDNNGYGTLIYPLVKFKDDNYTCQEREVLQAVVERFRGISASCISERSHGEQLWIERQLKQEIPLEEAYKLTEFK
ncbi:MAG: Panacea domain-containing protein [Zhenhengia sp.]|uniref:Panacea domain-containing protein n=1 Tax=Zhenhengia sp. TaxID=2944208 RepID=UPI003995A28D